MPGPVPKRRRTGHMTKAQKAEREPTVIPGTPVLAPMTPEGLHPIAARWFDSLRESGQAHFYEPSDWAAAELTAHAMTKMLNARTLSAMAFSAIWSAMGELLTTEGARRRVRATVERERVQEETPPGVSDIDAFRMKQAQ